MDLVEKVKKLIEGFGNGIDDYDSIKNDGLFDLTKKHIVSTIDSYLVEPNTNAMKAGIAIPDKKYEKKLLSYNDSKLPDEQKIYWMNLLGEIGSKKAYDRIKKYTLTDLFHQAFISMGKIDMEKTVNLFEDFLDAHLSLYSEDNETKKHDSGYNTLVELMKIHKNPEDILNIYNFSKNSLKQDLVSDALKEAKDAQYQ